MKLTDYTDLELDQIVVLKGNDMYEQQDVTIFIEDLKVDKSKTLEDVVIVYLQLGYTAIPF